MAVQYANERGVPTPLALRWCEFNATKRFNAIYKDIQLQVQEATEEQINMALYNYHRYRRREMMVRGKIRLR